MASTSMLPTNLSAFGGGVADIFMKADNLVQTVGSIYDQITGKSQSVPSQTKPAYSQSPAAPVPVKTSDETSLLNSGSTLAVGAVVLIGVLLLLVPGIKK